MLVLRVRSGEDRYALDARRVIEVVPAVPLRPVAGAPTAVAGVLHYRGRVVPVVDLSRYLGRGPSRAAYSTRIVLLDLGEAPTRAYDDREDTEVLGLIAEHVLELATVDADAEGAWTPPAGDAHEALGPVLPGEALHQVVAVEDLLDPALIAELVGRAREDDVP